MNEFSPNSVLTVLLKLFYEVRPSRKQRDHKACCILILSQAKISRSKMQLEKKLLHISRHLRPSR